MQEYFASFDKQVMDLLREYGGKWDMLPATLASVNQCAVYVFIALLVYAFFRYRRVFWSALLSLVGARLLLIEAASWLTGKARLSIADEARALIDISSSSFLGWHEAFFFAIATVFYFESRLLGRLIVAGAVVAAIAEIYTGLVSPSDALIGALVGAVSGFVIDKVFQKFGY